MGLSKRQGHQSSESAGPVIMHASEQAVRLVTADVVACFLSTSTRHLRRLMAEKEFPFVKVGHFVRFDLDDVSRWVEKQKVCAVGGCSGKELPWARHSSGSLEQRSVVAPRTSRQQAPSSIQEPVPWVPRRPGRGEGAGVER
jgi:excisionase family DNA binding protein